MIIIKTLEYSVAEIESQKTNYMRNNKIYKTSKINNWDSRESLYGDITFLYVNKLVILKKVKGKDKTV